MSTRVEGAAPPEIRLTGRMRLAVGTTCLMLTVTEEADGLWKYNLSEQEVNGRTESRAGWGRLTAGDHMTALRRAAAILADGYLPGTAARGLLEAFAEGRL